LNDLYANSRVFSIATFSHWTVEIRLTIQLQENATLTSRRIWFCAKRT